MRLMYMNCVFRPFRFRPNPSQLMTVEFLINVRIVVGSEAGVG